MTRSPIFPTGWFMGLAVCADGGGRAVGPPPLRGTRLRRAEGDPECTQVLSRTQSMRMERVGPTVRSPHPPHPQHGGVIRRLFGMRAITAAVGLGNTLKSSCANGED